MTDSPANTIARRRLRGGLDARSVEWLTFRSRHDASLRHVVCKELRSDAVREADLYERLLAQHGAGVSPRLLSAERRADGSAVLYLEAVRADEAWPWRDVSVAQRVLDTLARFHAASADATSMLPAWDYELELTQSAEKTVLALERCRRDARLFSLSVGIPAARRLARILPHARRVLVDSPLGWGPIHGDVHTGNVLVRGQRGNYGPVLLDWGRARIGSPLEDVSSWLQSLSYWEPKVRSKHDTLLSGYLRARSLSGVLDPHLRRLYWLAGASNAFAGALRYHVDCAREARNDRQRIHALAQARDWLRILRRADAAYCLVTPRPARGGHARRSARASAPGRPT